MKTYYVGMDVHRASIVIVVLNGAGKVVIRQTPKSEPNSGKYPQITQITQIGETRKRYIWRRQEPHRCRPFGPQMFCWGLLPPT
jgi:hypothetical protein